MKKIAEVIATEARAKYNMQSEQEDRDIYKGLTLWSPNVNIFRDPRWGRGHETYGEDPYLTSRLGVAFIKDFRETGSTSKRQLAPSTLPYTPGRRASAMSLTPTSARRISGRRICPPLRQR